MFSDDPDEYLLTLKEFLLARHAEKEDPAAAALVAEIYRELLHRVESASLPC